MTDFMYCRQAIEFCSNMRELRKVWREISPRLSRMPKSEVKAIIHTKDFYKSMIERGEIEAYLHRRRVAMTKDRTTPAMPPAAKRAKVKKYKKSKFMRFKD